jgi:hypothetical protein
MADRLHVKLRFDFLAEIRYGVEIPSRFKRNGTIGVYPAFQMPSADLPCCVP